MEKAISLSLIIICNKEKDCLDYNINGRNGYRNKKCKICLSIFLKEKKNNPVEMKNKTLEISKESTRVCKACGIEYPINHFWSIHKDKGTRNSRCKTCYKKKIYIYKETKGPKYNIIPPHKQSYNQIFRLTNVKKEDYVLTYKFLSVMGYDISKNISKQFILFLSSIFILSKLISAASTK